MRFVNGCGTHSVHGDIAQGYADVVLAAGMEHLTRVPRGEHPAIKQNPALVEDERYKHWELEMARNMRLTADCSSKERK
jgi:acetyl-CoA C-acetyltransferase